MKCDIAAWNAAIFWIVLMLQTVDGQSTNKLSQLYDNWIDGLSTSTGDSDCPVCFQRMAENLAEQLTQVKEEASEDVDVFDKLKGLLMEFSDLRNIAKFGLLELNNAVDPVNNSTIYLIGATGATGPTGPTGPTGAIGRTGVTGQPGGTGVYGASGQAGPSGNTGDTGLPGSPGQMGPPGRTGGTGYTGSIGFTGSQGVIGSKGLTGPVGDPGQQGAPGPR